VAKRMALGGPRVRWAEVVFLRRADRRQVRVPEHAEQASRWTCRYELSRKQTRRCCSRRICLAVSRSTTCIGPWQQGHCQTGVS
jgi:hypothetical protein